VKLSEGVEWGIHCAALLSLAPPGVAVRREFMATHYGLPEAYLGKNLRAMARAGLLSAVPGPRGGYRLARPAARITVLDVVEALEGSAPVFTCQEIRQHGSGALPPSECARPCTVDAVMRQAENAWRSTLRSVTVADLADRLPSRIRERNQRLLEPNLR
jgi:Rrf2 family protein